MNISIIGAGALGLLFASKCARNSEVVELVVHSIKQKELLNKFGIHLIKASEPNQRSQFKVYYSAFEDYLNNPNDKLRMNRSIDWVFLMVKQQQIDNCLIEFLKRYTKTGAKVLCFQNGIGHIERLAMHIPKELIFAAITTEGAIKESLFQVKHTTQFGKTWIGHHDKNCIISNNGEKKIINYLNNAGFDVISSKNINSIIWKKLIMNSVINPLTAILQVRNGELLRSDHWIKLMRALYDEARQITNALDIELSEELWSELLNLIRSTSENNSSMLQDLQAGKKTEIDWINGALIRKAQQKGISVPTHEAMYQMVKGINRE